MVLLAAAQLTRRSAVLLGCPTRAEAEHEKKTIMLFFVCFQFCNQLITKIQFGNGKFELVHFAYSNYAKQKHKWIQ